MNIIENVPVKITLNSYGGCDIDFGDFRIWLTIGNKWRIERKSGMTVEDKFDTVVEAYLYAKSIT